MEEHKSAKILAEAFLHYPLMLYAFDGHSEAERKKKLEHLYQACTKASSQYGGVEIIEDKASAIWLSGENFPLGLFKELQSGMISIPWNIGIKPTLRLTAHDAVSESWIKHNATAKFGYIWCIGVMPNEQGKGLSRILIDACIEKMEARGLSEFWLKTEDAKNVAIYQKLGFQVMFETVVKSSGIKSWAMRKL